MLSFNFLACLLLYLAPQHVLLLSQHVYLFYNMFYCFDVVGLAFFDQDMSKFHIYAQMYMFMCFLPCLYLDLHVYVLFAMFLLISTYLCAFCHACAQIYTFMCFCNVCIQIYMFGCYAQCFYSIFVPCFLLFLMFGFWVGCRSRSSGLGLHPYTHVSINFWGLFLYACLCFFFHFPCFLLQICACLLTPKLFIMFWLFSLCGFVDCWSLGLLACLVV